MGDRDQLFATTHFLGPESDLYSFSDAVMHWDCYAKWEHRQRFARMYFESAQGWKVNQHWSAAHSDTELLVTVNTDKFVAEVDITLAQTGSGFRVALAEWEDWLAGEWFESCHHEIERDALGAVIPLLRSKLPTPETIASAAGRKIGDEPSAQNSGMVTNVMYEFAFRKMAARAAEKGVACPGCGIFSNDYKCVSVKRVAESGPQSCLVCRGCGKEFGPLDVG